MTQKADLSASSAAVLHYRSRPRNMPSAAAATQPGTGAGGGRLAGGGGLVVEGDLGDAALDECAAGRRVGDREGVEADAAHEGDEVGQHVANGAQLAPIPMLLAQQPGRGE